MFKVGELAIAAQGRLLSGAPEAREARIRGISIDSRTINSGDAFIAIKGDNFDGHDFIESAINKGAVAVVLQSQRSPAYRTGRAALIKVNDTTRALGSIARHQRRKFDIPVIAVTGSSGKTTVKEMVAWILSAKFKVLKNEGTKNNHIGLPLTLLNLKPDHDIAVLEAGTNHFGEVGYLCGICLPNIGIITNIGPAHLEYFGTLKGVFKEKYSLIRNLDEPCISVLNADDRLLREPLLRKSKRPFTLGFSLKNQSDFSASRIKCGPGGIEFLVNEKHKVTLNTSGNHNVYNALAAVTVGRILGLEYKDIVSRFAAFDFPRGRFKAVKLDNIRFIDDTYNSNPLSLTQALDSLSDFSISGRKIFVMGDMLELGEAKESFHYAAGRKAAKVCDTLIAVGKLSRAAAAAARAYGFDTENIFTCETPREARDILFNVVSPRKDDIVLVKGSRGMKMEEIFKLR